MISKVIYKRDSGGKLRSWQYEVEGDKYRTIAGVVGGSLVTSAWTVCIGKQKRSNEEQALFEGNAELVKKLDREYRDNTDDLDSVPPSPMLAKKYEDEKAAVEKALSACAGVYSQPKLDGIRAFFSRYGAFSREYQRHLNVDHILELLAPLFAADPDLILDGELYNHDFKDDFGRISSIVRKQKPTPEQRDEAKRLMQYHVYDIASAGNNRFGDRFLYLFNLLAAAPPTGGVIYIVETKEVSTQAELDELNGQYTEAGYEGQMVRLNGPYEVDKRSKFLLKRKEFETAEFPFTGVEEGLGNWAGYAKRVLYEMPDGSEGKAGMRGNQAFAKELLTKVWKPGSTVTVRFFRHTPDGAHRFPVAIDFHDGGRVD